MNGARRWRREKKDGGCEGGARSRSRSRELGTGQD